MVSMTGMSRNKFWGLEASTKTSVYAPLIEMTAELIPYCKNFKKRNRRETQCPLS